MRALSKKERRIGPPSSAPRSWLFGTFAVALGIAFGYLGPTGWNELLTESPSTPRARVGYALEHSNTTASQRAWKHLASDSKLVRGPLSPEERLVFDLVVATMGLETGGIPQTSLAEEHCKQLKWPRCDASTLAELSRRVLPQ